jgi:hypothetical protein
LKSAASRRERSGFSRLAYRGYGNADRNAVPIDPKFEEPTRDLLKHVVRGEYQEIAKLIEAIGEQRFAERLSLCLRVAGYIAINISGHRWPTDTELRRIAQLTAETDLGFDLAEADTYDYLARAALGFEPLLEALPDKEKAASVPLLATASLLVAYRTDGRHW